ncbi:ferric reductase-like transmembrane domain-containing protein, partial [candidate division WWE3 bacterium]|nr:ferric reductase-like transmembrane domain-containing protein [candidate division WWE3 bacterium]
MNFHFLQLRRLKIRVILLSPLVITFVLWWLAKIDRGSVVSISELPRLGSQIVALWSVILLSYSYILSSRTHVLEKFLRGLDKVYQYHALIGKAVFVCILLHPALLIIYHFGNWSEVMSLIIPFVGNTSLAKSAALVGLFLYVLLISVTLLKVFSYHIWKLTHSFIGIPFFLISYHSLFAESDVKHYVPLQIWMLIWIGVGILAYLYITLLYKSLGPKHRYSVSSVKKVG